MKSDKSITLVILFIVVCVLMCFAIKMSKGLLKSNNKQENTNIVQNNEELIEQAVEEEIDVTESLKNKFSSYELAFENINSNLNDNDTKNINNIIFDVNLFEYENIRYFFTLYTMDNNCTDEGEGEGSKTCDLTSFNSYYKELFNKEFNPDNVTDWRLEKIEDNKVYGTLPSGSTSLGVENKLDRITCNSVSNECVALYNLNDITFDNEGNEINNNVGVAKLDFINNGNIITINSYILSKVNNN